jgi:flagellar biosynthesis protein FlhB
VAGSDKGQKTEQATPRRRREAREKGQIPKTPDLVAWSQLLAATYLVGAVLSLAGTRLQGLAVGIDRAVTAPDVGTALALFGEGTRAGLVIVAPMLLGMLVIGVVGSLAQVGFSVSVSRLKPDLKRLDPVKGFKRLVAPTSLWEAAKVLVKAGVLAAVAWGPMSGIGERLVAEDRPPLAAVLPIVAGAALTMVRNVALAGLVLAAADYAVQRRKVRKDMMMTKKEVTDEHKQQEGDPHLRAHLRQRQLAVSRNRMIADVAGADVVVVNPTHVAVALRYDPERGAPRVVAKGRGVVATRIREEALLHRVPLVRDVPLARSLHGACAVGQEIPADMYEAVARLLAFVMSLRHRPNLGGVLALPA